MGEFWAVDEPLTRTFKVSQTFSFTTLLDLYLLSYPIVGCWLLYVFRLQKQNHAVKSWFLSFFFHHFIIFHASCCFVERANATPQIKLFEIRDLFSWFLCVLKKTWILLYGFWNDDTQFEALPEAQKSSLIRAYN